MTTSTTQHYGKAYSGNAAENYERYFVPRIPGPLAIDLVNTAGLKAGERVLDVGCGTGVVARLAAAQVGATGTVDGVDPTPGMLAVARAITPRDRPIAWHEASAEALPAPDGSYDVVLSQLALMFFPDKSAALRQMWRVLTPGGRLAVNVPGSIAELMTIFADGLARHIGPALGGFVHQVFSLHDAGQLRDLIRSAGFQDVTIQSEARTFHLPAPAEFLWQYIYCTPLAGPVAQASDEQRAALERDIVARWQPFVQDGGLRYDQEILVATARK